MDRLFHCDPAKRASLLEARGFDLLAASAIFEDARRVEYLDSRFDYGEERRVTIGKAFGGIFTVVYTMRGPVTWLITAWPASRKERQRYERR
jgi:uncharacterized DUF497 family protein